MEQNRYEPPGSSLEPRPQGEPHSLEGEGRRAAGVVAGKVKERVAQTVEERKEHASGSLEQIAQALHDVSRSLEGNGLSGVSQLSDRAAGQVERTADYLRRRDFDGLLHDTRDMARRHPEVFVGAALLAGIVLGRFLRSSTPDPESDAYRLALDDELGEPGFGAESSFADGSFSEPSSSYEPRGGWA